MQDLEASDGVVDTNTTATIIATRMGRSVLYGILDVASTKYLTGGL
jgi:hypothetical protein